MPDRAMTQDITPHDTPRSQSTRHRAFVKETYMRTVPIAGFAVGTALSFALAAYLVRTVSLSLGTGFLIEMVPGLVAREFFNRLAGPGTADLGLPWFIALLLMAACACVAFLFGLALTNFPFMRTSTALLQKNMLRRILELPAAGALADSPGEAISRFRDDTDEVGISFLVFNNTIAATIFASVALVIMVRINALITLAVFLPLALVIAVFNVASHRIETYRKASREATGMLQCPGDGRLDRRVLRNRHRYYVCPPHPALRLGVPPLTLRDTGKSRTTGRTVRCRCGAAHATLRLCHPV